MSPWPRQPAPLEPSANTSSSLVTMRASFPKLPNNRRQNWFGISQYVFESDSRKSNKFEDVKKLTSALSINIEKDKFEDIIPKIKNFKNRRSIDRLKGMFAKNIRVGPAEKELEKGIKKHSMVKL
jgi:hypothetical protein